LSKTLNCDLPSCAKELQDRKHTLVTPYGSCRYEALPQPFRNMKECYLQAYFREKTRLRMRNRGQAKSFARAALAFTLDLIGQDTKLRQAIQENFNYPSSDDTGISNRNASGSNQDCLMANAVESESQLEIKRTLIDLFTKPSEDLKKIIRNAVNASFDNQLVTTSSLESNDTSFNLSLKNAVTQAFQGDLMLLSIKREKASANLKVKRLKDNSGGSSSPKSPIELAFDKLDDIICKCSNCLMHFVEANKNDTSGRNKLCCCNTCLEHIKNTKANASRQNEFNNGGYRGKNKRFTGRWNRGY
jgi:hypothetical protein